MLISGFNFSLCMNITQVISCIPVKSRCFRLTELSSELHLWLSNITVHYSHTHELLYSLLRTQSFLFGYSPVFFWYPRTFGSVSHTLFLPKTKPNIGKRCILCSCAKSLESTPYHLKTTWNYSQCSQTNSRLICLKSPSHSKPLTVHCSQRWHLSVPGHIYVYWLFYVASLRHYRSLLLYNYYKVLAALVMWHQHMGLHVIRCVKWTDIRNMIILTGTTVNGFFDKMNLNRMRDKEVLPTLSDVTENLPEYFLTLQTRH